VRRLSLAVSLVAALAAAYALGSYTRSRTADFGTVHAKDTSPVLPPAPVVLASPGPVPSGLAFAPVERGGAALTLRAIGRVLPVDTRIYKIDGSIDGQIRNTFNDSVGTLVKKDQRLATFYAPEFLPAATGYMAAVQGVKGAIAKDGARFNPEFPGIIAKEGPRSIQGYKDRLRNFGMSPLQIQQIADRREVPEVIDIVSPADGVILSRTISPGEHVGHHAEFYRIADLGQVWVVAEVDEQAARYLSPGTSARVTLAAQGRQLPARVAASLQQSETGGRTVKLRLEVENPALLLRPEMVVDVALPVRMPSALTVPADALVFTGQRARVYVASAEGAVEPREVETGWRSAGRVEIVKGLRIGERVVLSAAFLADSESRLKMPAARRADAN
jgi:Cu(I)/Ag(I) efflux system membrane fusion protein